MRWHSAVRFFRVGAPVCCATLFVAGQTGASLNFDAAVQDHLALADKPECVLCHRTDVGGDGTVVTPFGVTAQQFGVHGDNDTGALIAALNQMQSRNTDSDRDGVGDIAELRMGSDPNVFDAPPGSGGAAGSAGAGPVTPPPTPSDDLPVPQTGCSTGRAAPSAIGLFGLASLLGLAARRRRLARGR